MYSNFAMSLWERLHTRFQDTAVVLVDHGPERREFTGRELSAMVEDAARRFATQNVRRIGLCAPNSAELVANFLGALRAGAAVVPFHAGTPRAELELRTARFAVDLLLGPDDLTSSAPIDHASPVLPNAYDAPALLLSTSGTTGQPRAVVVSRRALSRHTSSLVDHVLGLGIGDRVLLALPLAHSYGCRMGLLAPLAAGAVIHLVPRFSAHATLEILNHERITWVPVVPTMLSAWVALEGATLPDLRSVLSAGAPLPEGLRRRATERLGCEVREGYGLTEASFSTVDISPPAPGTVGPPVPGVEVRIVDGEVELRGDNVMDGYLDDPEATRAAFTPDGWLRTGDLGELVDGRLRILDRKKDIILRGGQTIYPAEVEHILALHEAVAEVAVFGLPDPHLGERVAAAIVTRGPLDPKALRLWLGERLTPYKVPEDFYEVDSLPLGASGKVLKRVLRSRFVK